MALFKINKGKKANLPQTYNEGYCYFTTDDGKFYIDTTNTAAGRVVMNAYKADRMAVYPIPENTDLNTLTTPGHYGAPYHATNETLINNPVSAISTGIYLKVYLVNSSIIMQELIATLTGGIYKRRLSSGNWSEWVQMATVSDNVASATKLATGRTLKVNLASTSASTAFNGTANITNIGVSGTLPIANGGTGATTAAAARSNLGTLSSTAASGYYGMGAPDGSTDVWIRTTTLGIIPYQSGGSSALGTSSWPFSNAYINTVYGNLNGNATTATALAYATSTLTTDELIDNFNYANKLSVALWNNTSTPGVTNGIIINGGWNSTTYGFQLAIDDDPTYYIALRQKSTDGWHGWKRIPMGDGTGASGTWGINVTGSASKLGTSTVGSSTGPIYLSSGTATACSGRTVPGIKGASAASTLGWGTNNNYVPDISLLAYWNGAYSTTASNLAYCNRGAFGTIVTKSASDYLAISGGTMTGQIKRAGSSTSWISGRDTAMIRIHTYNAYNAITSMKTTNGSWEMGVYTGDWMYFTYAPDTQYNAGDNSGYTQVRISSAGGLYGAVWNDYAEYRDQNESLTAGYIAYCDDDGKLKYTTKRLQKFEGVISDTFGFAIGETDECKTPLAVSGRVLVYCDPADNFHSGDCVCAGPDGIAYRMTREEIMMYPDRIVGVVSEIPTYEHWGSGNVKINGRIWIKVK